MGWAGRPSHKGGRDAHPTITIKIVSYLICDPKRHLSLRRFSKALGYAPSQESSGDLQKSKVSGGSDLCRRALWQWIFTRIEPARARLQNDIGSRLGEIMDAEKASGRPVRLVRSRVAASSVKLLFKELTHELVYSQNPSIESEIEY